MLVTYLKNLRRFTPLVHNITNYVTVNDCANVLLAVGALPIMADDLNDAIEITAICSALNINIGTLNCCTIPAMFAAGKRAKELNHAVILDPVGAGASKLRTETALRLLAEVQPTVVRGNISEIKALFFGSGSTRGVDADAIDSVTDDNLGESINFARKFSEKFGTIIAITGAIDIVSNTSETFVIRNGHPMMSKVTGTGCMLSALTAAFAVIGESTIEAVTAAVAAMGLCGEKAFARLGKHDGNATYRNFIIDEMYNLIDDKLDSAARYEQI
jgi:hydroxyethylthiazole kinase